MFKQVVFFLVGIITSPTHLSAMILPGESFSCRRSSPKLNECVKEGLAKVFAKFKDGDPDIGVPPLEPLEIPFLMVNHDETNLGLNITLRNILISGMTDIQLIKVTANLEDVYKLEVSAKTPLLHVTGEYLSDGLIVNFPLHSSGSFSINMTEVTSSWVVYLKEQSSNGVLFLQVDRFNVDMMPLMTSFRPAEQLDGDNRLGEAMNVILNENSSEMYSIIKDKVSEVMSGLLTELANLVLKQVPADEYLRP